MNESSATHPLDRDDELDSDDAGNQSEPFAKLENRPASAAHKMLRPAVIGLCVCFGLAFLSGVMAANAQPRSFTENSAAVVNRLAVIGMLIAFCCILVAYRIPYLKRLRLPERAALLRSAQEMNLYAANTILLAIVWTIVLMFTSALGPVLAILGSGLLLIYVALLVTMVIWHTGYLRAYAVGSLSALVALIYSGTANMWMYSSNLRGTALSAWPVGAALTFVVLAGIICATYVRLITREPNTETETHA